MAWTPSSPAAADWAPAAAGAGVWTPEAPQSSAWTPESAGAGTWSPVAPDSGSWEETRLKTTGDYSITGLWTFDRDPLAPFAVSAGSAYVPNLDADKLDGQEGSYYLAWANLTGVPAEVSGMDQGVATTDSPTFAGMSLTGDLTMSAANIVMPEDYKIGMGTGLGNIYFSRVMVLNLLTLDSDIWGISADSGTLGLWGTDIQTNGKIHAGGSFDVDFGDKAIHALELLTLVSGTTQVTWGTHGENVSFDNQAITTEYATIHQLGHGVGYVSSYTGNFDTQAGSAARYIIYTEGTGDAAVVFSTSDEVGGGSALVWAAGLDTSDSGSFKLHPTITLPDAAVFELTTAGALALASGLTVGGDITLSTHKLQGFDAAVYMSSTDTVWNYVADGYHAFSGQVMMGRSGAVFAASTGLEVYANGADIELLIHEDAGTHQPSLHLRRGAVDWEVVHTGTDLYIEYETGRVFNFGATAHASDNSLLMRTTAAVQFRDAALYINSGTDGTLNIVADSTVAISGACTMDNQLTITRDLASFGGKFISMVDADGGEFYLGEGGSGANLFYPFIRATGNGIATAGLTVLATPGTDSASVNSAGIILDGRNASSALANSRVLQVRNYGTNVLEVLANGNTRCLGTYRHEFNAATEYINSANAGYLDFAAATAVRCAADFIMAAGKDVDCYTNGGYLKPRRLSQSAQPTPDTGELLVWHDSDDDSIHLVYEDPTAGTVETVLA